MNKLWIYTLCFALPFLCFAQKKSKGNYPFVYPLHLKDDSSFYTVEPLPTEKPGDSVLLKFVVKDGKNESIAFVNISMLNKQLALFNFKDSSLIVCNRSPWQLFYTDGEGELRLSVKPESQEFTISGLGYCKLEINDFVPLASFSYQIKITLGANRSLWRGKVHSNRKLSVAELEQIADDIVQNRESELIKNMICYLRIEI